MTAVGAGGWDDPGPHRQRPAHGRARVPQRGGLGAAPDADLYDAPEPAAAALDAARAEALVVVDPYLIDCVMEGAVAVPVSYRERVRALGPTIHPDMGKQAQGGEAVRVLQAAQGSGRSTGRLSLIARKK